MPEWLVFLSGFATDVLTYGPLGYWALVYLLGYIAVVLLRQDGERGEFAHWLEFAATLAGLALAQWLIASLYLLGWSDWRPVALAAVACILGYPLLVALLRPIDRLWQRRSNDTLARGR